MAAGTSQVRLSVRTIHTLCNSFVVISLLSGCSDSTPSNVAGVTNQADLDASSVAVEAIHAVDVPIAGVYLEAILDDEIVAAAATMLLPHLWRSIQRTIVS